jgi:short-subunit dehydrogenase
MLALAVVFAGALSGCAISPKIDSADEQKIAGQTFVVTGATSGFGRGVALQLAQHRANVVIAARRTEVLEQLVTELRGEGGQALAVTTDVGNAEDVRRLADAAVARFGRIDVWINNAGVVAIGRFEDVPVKDYSRLIDTNVKGVIYGSHVAMQQFRQQGYGTLVNIGSVESEVPLAYHAVYSASKAAVLSLGRALNEEIRLSGNDAIRVATVLPWAADTPVPQHAANYSGRTPQLIMMDDPQMVVDAIVWTTVHPREEMPVGWKANGAYVMHHLLPDTTESMAASMQHRTQMENAPASAPTSGALYAPTSAGTDVDGGNRARMEREQHQGQDGQGDAASIP